MNPEIYQKPLYRDNPLEALTNQYFQLQRLQEEGKNVTPLLEKVWGQITDIIHGEDEVKLKNVRERIKDIIKEEVHHEQEGWCGPACLSFIAEQEHIDVTQSELAQLMGTSHENGTSHEQMLMGAKEIGLKPTQVLGMRIDTLAEVLPNYHVIVNWMSGSNDADDGHYSVLKSVTENTVVLEDREMKMEDFEKKWYDIEKEGRVNRWAMIVKRTP